MVVGFEGRGGRGAFSRPVIRLSLPVSRLRWDRMARGAGFEYFPSPRAGGSEFNLSRLIVSPKGRPC